MSKYRPVFCQFWNDGEIEKLSPEEKLIFLFLFTNESTSESGIYEITPRRIAERTGVKEETAKLFITSCNKITYDEKSNIVFVHAFFKRNHRGRPDLLEKSILADAKNYSSPKCWQDFIKTYQDLHFINKIKDITKSCQVFTKTSMNMNNESEDIINNNINTINWKSSLLKYQEEEKTAYQTLLKDAEWLAKQERLKKYPNLNIIKTLEKSHEYWQSEAAWKLKKSKKTKEIDWKRTFENALSNSQNHVFNERKNPNDKTIDQLYGNS